MPVKIHYVHGTWGRGFEPRDKQARTPGAQPYWFESGSPFRSDLEARLADAGALSEGETFLWSGANSMDERRRAADELAGILDAAGHNDPDVPQIVVAHSHGGNVALAARDSMSASGANVHIITLATPFLEISRLPVAAVDKLFAVILALCLVGIAAALLMYSTAANDDETGTAGGFLTKAFLLPFGISMFLLLAAALRKWARTSRLARLADRAPACAMRANKLTLIACVSILISVAPFSVEAAIFSVVVAFPAIAAVSVLYVGFENGLYGNAREAGAFRKTDALVVLRSPRDEASFALGFGKIASALSRAGALLSVVVSTAAIVFVVFLGGFVIYYAVEKYLDYEQCVAMLGGRTNNGQCTVPGEKILLLGAGVAGLWAQQLSIFCFGGLLACAVLIAVTSAAKAMFGRELLFR